LSKSITNALLKRTGPFSEVLKFIEAYEKANWQEVTRVMMVNGIRADAVYNAYLSSFGWYKKLLSVD